MTNNISSNWKDEALSEQTPPTRLKFLAGINVDLARLVATNANANSELLTALASSRDFVIRAKVAGNPNTPPNVLWQLAEKFPHEFLENPILPLLFLEDPNCLLEQPLGVLLSLLKKDIVPSLFLLEATRHKDFRILFAVAKNSQITDEIVAKLIETENRDIQLYLASNPNISVKSLELLFQAQITNHKERVDIYQAVAKHPHTSIKISEKLAFNAESKIKKAVASRCDLTVNLIAKMATDRQIIAKKFLLRNRHFSPEILFTLATHSEPKVRQMVALHPNTSISLLKQLSKTRSLCSFVAQNPNVTVEILEQLAETNNPEVYLALTKNHQTPSHILEKIANQTSNAKILIPIVENRNTAIDVKREIIDTLTESRQFSILKYIAQSPYISDNILISWSYAKYYRNLRPWIAKNPKTPIIVLDTLARKYCSHKVAMGLAKNPNTTLEILNYLYKRYKYGFEKVLTAIAKHKNAPNSELMRRIRLYKWASFFAKNAETSEDFLIKLSKHYCGAYHQALLKNPSLPSIALENILKNKSQSFHVCDRKFAARHSKTPINVLEKLTKDRDKGVRDAAEYRLKRLMEN